MNKSTVTQLMNEIGADLADSAEGSHPTGIYEMFRDRFGAEDVDAKEIIFDDWLRSQAKKAHDRIKSAAATESQPQIPGLAGSTPWPTPSAS